MVTQPAPDSAFFGLAVIVVCATWAWLSVWRDMRNDARIDARKDVETAAELRKLARTIDANLWHQSEKIEDVPRALRRIAAALDPE